MNSIFSFCRFSSLISHFEPINQWVHGVTAELQCTDTSYPLGGFPCLFIQSPPVEQSELTKPEISCSYSEKRSGFVKKLLSAIFLQSPYGEIAVVKCLSRIELPLYL